jgi:hypothetical protein
MGMSLRDIGYWACRNLLLPQMELFGLLRGDFGLAPPRVSRGASAEAVAERAWWERHLFRTLRRVLVRELGRLLLLAVAVVVLAVVLFSSPGESRTFEGYSGLGLAIAAVIADVAALATCYGALLLVRRLPPDAFADIALAGRDPSEVLRAMAWEIRATAGFFLVHTRRLHGVISPTMLAGDGDPRRILDVVSNRPDEWRAQVLELRRVSSTFYDEIRRLIAMKTRAAELLGMEPRSFCDHIVQYSPGLHLEFFSKYVANWEYILDARNQPGDPSVVDTRVVVLARENRRMVEKVETRSRIQADLFHFVDLHVYLHAIAAQQSTSEATLVYARAIAHVAAHAASGRLSERLQFLRRKQHAYPGFDLHRSCLQLCEQAGVRFDTDAGRDLAQRQATLLRQLAERASNARWPSDPARADQAVLDLKQLAATAENYFAQSREEIANAFGKLAAAWFDYTHDRDATRAIVVFDYSKTVRQALKLGLQKVGKKLKDRDGYEHPLICVLVGPGHREQMAVRMIYELTEDLQYRREVAVGGESQIAAILGARARVMIVIGVEAFDDEGTLVHWRGAREHLANVRAALAAVTDSAEGRIAVVAVAADYKRSKTELDRVASLQRYHLRHVDLSRLDWDCLITDTATMGNRQRTDHPPAVHKVMTSWLPLSSP